MIYLSFLCLVVSVIGIWFFFKPFRHNVFKSIFLLMFSLTYFGGLVAIQVVQEFVGIGSFKGVNTDCFGNALLLSVACFLCLILGSKIRFAPFFKKSLSFNSVFGKISFFAALFSLGIYVTINGVILLQSDSYSARYESNIGLGVFSKYIFFGLFFLVLDYAVNRKKFKALFFSALFFVAVFFVMGGYRQVAFASVLNLILILYLNDKIQLRQVMIWSFLGVIIVNFIALFRYGIHVNEAFNKESLLLVSYFLFDGMIPVDAFLKILDHHTTTPIPGISIIYNQFSVYIPRFLWESKPIVVMNAGNYYTMEILNRENFITYSPTFLGELFLIGREYGCLFGSLVTGVLLRIVDKVLQNGRKNFMYYFMLSFGFLLVFNLYREGLFVCLSLILILAVLSLPLHFLSSILPVRKC